MKAAIAIAIFALVPAAQAGEVKGYTKKDGTYVAPHYRSAPDSNRYNNYNSRSNGGSQRDEFDGGATNKSNPGYNGYDNDGDGISNGFDD